MIMNGVMILLYSPQTLPFIAIYPTIYSLQFREMIFNL